MREEAFDVAGVLFRENLGGRHERRLKIVFHRGDHRDDGDDRFAAADVALQQTIHRRSRFHVVENLYCDSSLCTGELERHHGGDVVLDGLVNSQRRLFLFFDSLTALHADGKRHPEEVFEDHAPVWFALR